MKDLNELIEVVPYDAAWPLFFQKESEIIKQAFDIDRIVDLEHYGSTSVPGLDAKPIIDILVGLSKFYLSEEERKRLEGLGYEYFGLSMTSQRFFLRKRCKRKFNLAIVFYEGSVWNDCLAVRNFLRADKDETVK